MAALTAYLDTTIVSGLAKEDLKADKLEALLEILKQHKHGNVSLVTSLIVQEEIAKIPKESYRRKHEFIYNLLADLPIAKEVEIHKGMVGMGLGMGLGATVTNLHPMYEELSALLPDEADARHLFQAAMNDVQYFLTTDGRTILSYRKKIEQIAKVKAMNPVEFLQLQGSK